MTFVHTVFPCLDYDQLDPGIRDTVALLRAAGFETSDSGDGESKSAEDYASGEAIPFPHVAARTTPQTMLVDAERMFALLGEPWQVEATYIASTGTAYLFASRVTDLPMAEVV